MSSAPSNDETHKHESLRFVAGSLLQIALNLTHYFATDMYAIIADRSAHLFVISGRDVIRTSV